MYICICICTYICTCAYIHIRVHKQVFSNIGALIITYTILGVPYYNYRIMGPKPYSNYFGPYIIGICSQRLGGCYFAAAGTFIGFRSERGRFGLALKGTLRVPASEVAT